MKKLLLIATVLTSSLCFAQTEYNFVYSSFSSFSSPNFIKEVPEGVNSITQIVENNNYSPWLFWQEEIIKYKSTYNDSGKILTNSIFKDGYFQLIENNKYNEDGKIVFQEIYKKNGKLISTKSIKRNDDNEYLEYAFYKGKDDLKYFKTWEYNQSGKFKESKYFKGKNKKLKKRWVYEYYEGGQKKQSVLYNGKGKVQQVWSYECKQEGEKLTPKKDVTQLCKWEESDGKYLIKVTQSFNDKGKVYKSVLKFNIADTSLVEAKYFDGDNKLYSLGTYDGSVKKPLSRVSYHKGKEASKWIYRYENDHLVFKSYSYKNRTTTTEFDYTNDNLVALKVYDRHGELAKTTTYEYN